MAERLTQQEFGLATFCYVCARALVKSNGLPAIDHGRRMLARACRAPGSQLHGLTPAAPATT